MISIKPRKDWPMFWRVATEVQTVLEIGQYFTCYNELSTGTTPHTKRIMAVPGFFAADIGTMLLRNVLNAQGHDARGWGQGINMGPQAGVMERLADDVIEWHEQHGEPVHLIGWSLGGIFVRELAKEHAHAVGSVITLGTPFAGLNAQTVRHYFSSNGIRGLETLSPTFINQLHVTPPQPYTSIWSDCDNLIRPSSCQVPARADTENLQVHSSHFGMCHHPASVRIILDRLAQPAGTWRPYEREPNHVTVV